MGSSCSIMISKITITRTQSVQGRLQLLQMISYIPELPLKFNISFRLQAFLHLGKMACGSIRKALSNKGLVSSQCKHGSIQHQYKISRENFGVHHSKSLISLSSSSASLSLPPGLLSDICDPRDPWEPNRLIEVGVPFCPTLCLEGV